MNAITDGAYAPIDGEYRRRLFDYAWEFMVRSRQEDPLTRESRIFLQRLWQAHQLHPEHVATVEELILRGMERLKQIFHDTEQLQQGLSGIVKISLSSPRSSVPNFGAVNSGEAEQQENQVVTSKEAVKSQTIPFPLRRERQGQPQRSLWFAGLVIGSTCMTTVLTMLIAFSDLNRPDHQPEVDPSPAVSSALPTPSSEPTPVPSPSPSIEFEQPEKTQAWRDRATQLQVNPQFLEALLHEMGHHYDFSIPESTLPEVVNRDANYLLDKLQTLPVATRLKLGTYHPDDRERWATAGVNKSTLDRLADQKFYQLLPERQGKPTNPKTYGQIWFALAEEQLATAQATPVQPVPPRNRLNRDRRTHQRLRRPGQRVLIAGIN